MFRIQFLHEARAQTSFLGHTDEEKIPSSVAAFNPCLSSLNAVNVALLTLESNTLGFVQIM